MSCVHCASLFKILACVAIERFTTRLNMMFEEEKLIAKAYLCLGIAGAMLLVMRHMCVTNLQRGKR